ncbi:tyrosyl-DNA phosphodiesterase I [Sordaria brevicollis]|uniref:Tyrosyl-DNA phosphodiesterase I n=1 Tax=Sordaria brevicollis TaxID=83679 RepID=A0AAE0PIE6_SORBR|nr:tyrosyl-DNA phosphodiesterase I [Sordaria brevicollis]
MDHSRPPKRTVQDAELAETGDAGVQGSGSSRATPRSLSRAVSPPAKKRRISPEKEELFFATLQEGNKAEEETDEETEEKEEQQPSPSQKIVKSPFHLTTIRSLGQASNKDTVSLKDLLGDPLITECWEFNYLHDIDFLMNAFDDDVRHLVKVHVVHGFWKKEDPNRLQIQSDAARYPNITTHHAYLPEPFGTHHSKMMVLFRADDTAEIIIHTANLIPRDWGNMTQAAWISPRLPLLRSSDNQPPTSASSPPAGSGEKFKIDFLNYLRSYKAACKPLVDQLFRCDFSSIRGSLIASVPGRHCLVDDFPTRWGWAAMKETLKSVPVFQPSDPSKNGGEKPEIVIQISSIATLGPTDTWLKNTLFESLSGSQGPKTLGKSKPDFKIIFPTPDEIRKSLDGYTSGGSIHTKIQSAQQAKQLQYLRPMFCHWANDSADGIGTTTSAAMTVREAGRKRAAPHIKTFIRYADQKTKDRIDWALLTSANLSKQAWGDAQSKNNAGEPQVRICSYEIGVLVWPELFVDGDGGGGKEKAVMVPTFLTDTPTVESVKGGKEHGSSEGDKKEKVVEGDGGSTTVVGLRMPYNLPLQRYGPQEVPWVATANHLEPDWMGQVWRHE